MEFLFHKTACPYLRQVTSQIQTQEQTQEVRIPDGMPDIGRVLGCWGQALIRGKEWRSGGMTVTGGIMAWVLYAPEDGTEPRSMDTWIPFQMKWDLPDTQRDGVMSACARLKSMDARSTSARKLMLRAAVSVLGEAMESVDGELYAPETVPEDIQLLRRSYPMELPREAGEKHFQLDEELTLPENLPPVRKLIRYELTPAVQEQKVLGERLAFRGRCGLHLLYAGEEGSLHTWDGETAFSQYTELDRGYSTNAQARLRLQPTALELDRGETGRLHLKCGIAAQYVISDRELVEVVEDAYSPARPVEIRQQELILPVLLDTQEQVMAFSQSVKAEGQREIDTQVFWDHPVCRQQGDNMQAEAAAQYQVLYQDENGTLQSASGRFESYWELPSDRENRTAVSLDMPELPKTVFSADGGELAGSVGMQALVTAEQGLPMVTALQWGELTEPDPARPGVILRRLGESRLWDVAKECGSTVDAIWEANKLQQEPEPDRMLLIPVY